MVETISFLTLNMILSLILFGLSLGVPLFVIFFERQTIVMKDLPGLFLPYALFFNVGCLFFLGGMGQLLYAPAIAKEIGWAWSFFQYELGFSELCLALLGLISPLFTKEFWLATLCAASVWLLGASLVNGVLIMSLDAAMTESLLFVTIWNIVIALWLIVLYSLYSASLRQTTREYSSKN